MTFASKTHWVGVFLLFASTVLLLITTISAPVLNDVGLLRVTLTNATDQRHSSVSFGTFGYCILDVPPDNTDQDWCSGVHVGYDPAKIMAKIDHTSFESIARGTSDGLTNVMALHPIECALAFIAFLISCFAGVLGSLVGAFFAFLALILTVVSVAVDFSLFGIILHHVNGDGSGSHAYFGAGIWCLVAGFVALFFGMVIVFFTCCAKRREKKRSERALTPVEVEEKERSQGVEGRRKKFGVF